MEALVTIPGAEAWSAPSANGTRTGVVVVHGLTGNAIATRPLGQRLAHEGFAVEVVLLPGHGTNVRDFARTRYADWFGAVQRSAEHLAETCDHVVVVGHSMGGTIALDLASRRPDVVDAVAAINPQVLDREEALAKLGPLLMYVIPYVPREIAGLPTNDIARPGVEEGSYRLIGTKAAQSFLAELPRIRSQLLDLEQPLFVAYSPKDHSVPPRNAHEVLELVGTSRVTTFACDRSYHVPTLDYDAPALAEAIVEFVHEATRG